MIFRCFIDIRLANDGSSNDHGMSLRRCAIRGIQSRRFSCDSVAVSQPFLVRFVSSETTLNHPATLNTPFHFAFLMEFFIYLCRLHTLFGLRLFFPLCPGRLTAKNDVTNYSELTTSFEKATYSALEGVLDSNDALYALLAMLRTPVDQACLRHRFIQLVHSLLAQTLPQTLRIHHQIRA